jgi:hypothetical protein
LHCNEDITQDHCSRTIAMDGITLNTDGHFEFAPEDFTLPNGAMTEDLHMTGQLSDDLSTTHSIARVSCWAPSTSTPHDAATVATSDLPCIWWA